MMLSDNGDKIFDDAVHSLREQVKKQSLSNKKIDIGQLDDLINSMRKSN